VRRQFEEVFFDPSTPSENMLREVYDTVQSYGIVQRAIRFTRSIAKDQLHDRLSRIQVPSLLIWGEHDLIVPPETAALFKKLLPNADLHYIKHCGHVPTQERPKEVLPLIDNFLQKIHYV
jgi:pimeloyl-ACP methyl ester carboxylesterase